MDGMILTSETKRDVSFVIAEIVNFIQSSKQVVVGTLAKLVNAIPIKRPLDHTIPGTGIVKSQKNGKIEGINTKFLSEVSIDDKLIISNTKLKVKSIESDHFLTTDSTPVFFENSFKIIPKLNHKESYDLIQAALNNGKCIALSPEGFSHDLVKIFPLKPGVCFMAFGAMIRYNIPVTIQCVGLNYTLGHKFRSKVIINYGKPFIVQNTLKDIFVNDTNRAIEILLKNVKIVRKN